jgi:hypothetical protein
MSTTILHIASMSTCFSPYNDEHHHSPYRFQISIVITILLLFFLRTRTHTSSYRAHYRARCNQQLTANSPEFRELMQGQADASGGGDAEEDPVASAASAGVGGAAPLPASSPELDYKEILRLITPAAPAAEASHLLVGKGVSVNDSDDEDLIDPSSTPTKRGGAPSSGKRSTNGVRERANGGSGKRGKSVGGKEAPPTYAPGQLISVETREMGGISGKLFKQCEFCVVLPSVACALLLYHHMGVSVSCCCLGICAV